MNIDEFQEKQSKVDIEFEAQLKLCFETGVKIERLSETFTERYQSLINQGLRSDDTERLINYLAYKLCQVTLFNFNQKILHSALNEKAIPAFNQQFIVNSALKNVNSTISTKLDKYKKDRQKATAASHAKSEKWKQQILADYAVNKAKFASKDIAALHYSKDYALEPGTIRKYLRNK